MSKINFVNELNSFNSLMGVNSTSESKYDYFACEVSKKEQKSFRIKMRNSVKNFYASENLDLNFIKSFANIQSNALLVCTKEKRTFAELSIKQVYPNFEKLSETEQKQITDRHKKICSLLSLVEKKVTEKKVKKVTEKKEVEKIETK